MTCRFDFLEWSSQLLVGFKSARLREGSKRGSSTSRADSFAGAKLKKKRRLVPVGMTGLGLVPIDKESGNFEARKIGGGVLREHGDRNIDAPHRLNR